MFIIAIIFVSVALLSLSIAVWVVRDLDKQIKNTGKDTETVLKEVYQPKGLVVTILTSNT